MPGREHELHRRQVEVGPGRDQYCYHGPGRDQYRDHCLHRGQGEVTTEIIGQDDKGQGAVSTEIIGQRSIL